MKRLLMYFMLLFSLSSIGQSVIHTDRYGHKYNWECEQPEEWGSFWWSIERSKYPDKDGYYWYNVYFWSNSLLKDEKTGEVKKAISYVKDISISVLTDLKPARTISIDYVLVDYEKKLVAYFWWDRLDKAFKITFGKVSPYDYSVK